MLAVTEVNMFLYFRFFLWKQRSKKYPSLHQFRKQLAYELINNEWFKQEKGDKIAQRKTSDAD